MAIGLHTLQTSIYRTLPRCTKHSSDISDICRSKWRSITSMSLSPEFADDGFMQEERKPVTVRRQDFESTAEYLKEKEKHDWRRLTVAEKQALYKLSFNEPFAAEVANDSVDEWKLILGGSFTAMGIMLLAVYAYKSKLEARMVDPDMDSPISPKKSTKDQLVV